MADDQPQGIVLSERLTTYGEYKANLLTLCEKRSLMPGYPQLGIVFHGIHRYGELWCDAILPASGPVQLTRGAKRDEKTKPAEGFSVRATISFPSEIYKTMEDIARQKKVSLAWVVREAAEQYIADKWPLFGKAQGEKS